MVDRLFTDARLAAVYDAMCAGRDDFGFYLPLVMQARSVLDAGCGTGELLHLARQAGHTGRLCGLDPAPAMLDVARRRQPDVEWVPGELESASWDGEFDLAVMTGNAFQVLTGDDQLHTALTSVRSALTADGRFVFETRNPAVREWERWRPDDVQEVPDVDGGVVRVRQETELVQGGLVRFSSTFTGPGWDGALVSHSTLRFLHPDTLAEFLAGAGLKTEAQYGDWHRGPVTPECREIVTFAVRA